MWDVQEHREWTQRCCGLWCQEEDRKAAQTREMMSQADGKEEKRNAQVDTPNESSQRQMEGDQKATKKNG